MSAYLPAPRVPFVDPQTGLTTREYYRFLQTQLEQIGGLEGVVPVSSGGTGLASYTQGDLIYASAGDTLSKLGKTANNSYLSNGGLSNNPAWTTKAALTKVDDTNVTLTLSGGAPTSLLTATSITVGWSGTLAAARLNANVVQSVVDDTNVTGSIATQALTLGWAGQLALSRGGTGANLTASEGGIVYSGASAFAVLAGTATAGQIVLSGSNAAPSWSAATYPSTATAGRVMLATGTDTWGDGPAPVTDGTYTFDATSGNVASITFTNGIATGITVAP